MLSVLLKKQMTEIFRGYFFDAKKNKSRSKVSTALYIVLFVGIMAGLLGGMFTFLSLSICKPLADAGMAWMYFALMGLLSVFLGVFGSVFNTYSSLYLSKDNDLMLSLPIPVGMIMVSRLLSVYLMGLMYSIVVILPAVVVYWITASASAGAIFGCLLGYSLIADEMRDADLKALAERIGYTEGLPVVTDPGILSPKAFLDEVVKQRLPNPFLPDTPQRIATDTSQKLPIRFGETLKSYAARPDLDISSLTAIPLTLAGWLRYLLGVDDRLQPMEISPDPMKE